MLAVRGLDPGLRVIAIGLRPSQRFAHGAERSLDFVHTLFNNSDRGTQCLEAMLALDDTGVLIRAATHTQPVAPDPFAAASDDRLPRGQRGAHLERVGQ